MFEAETEVAQLESRLGRVGSIQAWDPWKSRQSVAQAKAWVAKVASISYGNTEAANPEHLFQKIVERGHLSCLEFVPGAATDYRHLPAVSMRHWFSGWDTPAAWGEQNAQEGSRMAPASAFLVTCPLYIRSQWMRHRSFSYLEMSRRYTKGSKVEWSYYGAGHDVLAGHSVGQDESMEVHLKSGSALLLHDGDLQVRYKTDSFHAACEAEYQRRLDAGWPNEIARGCMPMEAMTKFWVAGFDRDWRAFLKLRNYAHAQAEIRVFAQWIETYLDMKEAPNAA